MHIREHQDAETLYRLLEGRLEPGLERAVESHLWRCEACRALRDQCATILGALHWYGEWMTRPPVGHWDDFWARWPLAGDLRSRSILPGRVRRGRGRAAGLATAAAVVLAAGLWWSAGRNQDTTTRQPLSPPSPSPTAQAGARQLVVGTPWEGDVEAIERLGMAVGSMDPSSKGVALASLAGEP